MALHDAQSRQKGTSRAQRLWVLVGIRRGDAAVNVRIMPPQNTLERQNVIATIINSKRNLFQCATPSGLLALAS